MKRPSLFHCPASLWEQTNMLEKSVLTLPYFLFVSYFSYFFSLPMTSYLIYKTPRAPLSCSCAWIWPVMPDLNPHPSSTLSIFSSLVTNVVFRQGPVPKFMFPALSHHATVGGVGSAPVLIPCNLA